MAETTTATTTSDGTAARTRTPATPDVAPARTVDQVTRTPDAPTDDGQSSYTLLAPPSYDSIVGGVTPSPFVSVFFLAGLVIVILAAALSGPGTDPAAATQWWLLGGMLVVVATFLAGFVSRSN